MDFNPNFSFPASTAVLSSPSSFVESTHIRNLSISDAPNLQPPTRRGVHAHRRSAAMSEDLSGTLFGPLLKANGYSASPVIQHQATPELDTATSASLWDTRPSPITQRRVYFADSQPSPLKLKPQHQSTASTAGVCPQAQIPQLSLQAPSQKHQSSSSAGGASSTSESKHGRRGSIVDFISRKTTQLLRSSSSRKSPPPPSPVIIAERSSLESVGQSSIHTNSMPSSVAASPWPSAKETEPAIDLNDALSPNFASLSPSKRRLMHRHTESMPVGLNSPFTSAVASSIPPIAPVVEEEDEEAVQNASNCSSSSEDSLTAETQARWRIAHRRLGSELPPKPSSDALFGRSPEPNLVSLSIPEYGSPDSEFSTSFNDSPMSSSLSDLNNPAIAVRGQDILTPRSFRHQAETASENQKFCTPFDAPRNFVQSSRLQPSRPSYV